MRWRSRAAARRFAAAVLLVTLSLTRAAEASEAERLFQLGRRASEMGKFATACSLFRESQRLEPAVGTLLNLGDCEEQQNHVGTALDYFEDALSRLLPNDDRLAQLRTRIEAIEARSGRIVLTLGEGAPKDSRVVVDGELLAPEKWKKPLVVSAGGHLVLVTAVGYRGSRQQIDVTAGATKTVVVWPGPQLDATELALASDDERIFERQRAERGRTLRTVGFIASGVGLASLWAGSVTGVLAIDKESTRADNCDAENRCNRTGLDAARSGETLALVSTITVAAGALATATGVYLVLSHPPASEAKPPLAASSFASAKRGSPSKAPTPNPVARTSVTAIPLAAGGAAISFDHRF